MRHSEHHVHAVVILLDDLSAALTQCCTGCCTDDMNINHLVYADHLVVLFPFSVGLRELLSVWKSYCLNHEIKLNQIKSAILVSRGNYMNNICHLAFKLNICHLAFKLNICHLAFKLNICHLAFKLNGEDIKKVNSVKCLGRTICSDSKDDRDIMRQCRQLYARDNVLLRKCYLCTDNVNIKLFSTFCSSMYTTQLWWNHPQIICMLQYCVSD